MNGAANKQLVLRAALALAGLNLLAPPGRCEPNGPSYAMFADPPLRERPTTTRLADDSVALWRHALRRPETEFQRLAAQTIGDAAAEGFFNVAAARPELERLIADPATHPLVQHAAARALIALDARSAAPALFAASQRGGLLLRQLVEPALAEWGFAPICAVWRERLADRQVCRRELRLAFTGLARAGEATSLAAILTYVADRFAAPDIRLAAARAAGAIAPAGLEDEAAKLCSGSGAAVVDRLCALALLAEHRSETARSILNTLARDAEPAVASEALGRLLAIDPALVLPLAEEALVHRDAGVRRCAIDACLAVPDAARCALLGPRLGDPDPRVREHLREGLFRLSRRADLDGPIRGAAMAALASDDWRGQEQAALLLAGLDHRPAAGRLVQLLDSREPEVMIAAAWGLRRLAVPETLPAILEQAARQTDVCLATERPPPEVQRQLAHLLEALGLAKYPPAEPLLTRFVPKDFRLGDLPRSAAIWSLGLFHAETPDEELAQALFDRLTDVESLAPELPLVRRMCAVALGRMRAASLLPELRALMDVDPTVESPLRWAIEQMTGEPLPPLAPLERFRPRSFLEPLPPQEAAK